MRRSGPAPWTLFATLAWITVVAFGLEAVSRSIASAQTDPAGAGATDEVAPGDGFKPAIVETAPDGARKLLLGYGINNYGYIDVCGCKHKKIRQGSITRRASLLRQLRIHHPHMVLIDAGNTLFGREDRTAKDHERPQLIEKAKVLVEAYNRMGY
ncbi:MAG: hypothetical protein KDC38_15235, partial [Planctomycetes bacterium]|nr:hypothetical protein [Planctomycetota bacterium]